MAASTAAKFTVQDGYGYYIATDYSHAVQIALADDATACTVYKNGTAVALKAAGATVLTIAPGVGVNA